MEQSKRDVPAVNEAQLIAKRLRNYETECFEFIQTPGVEPTNNTAEQVIRSVTIDRHITQGTRTDGASESGPSGPPAPCRADEPMTISSKRFRPIPTANPYLC